MYVLYIVGDVCYLDVCCGLWWCVCCWVVRRRVRWVIVFLVMSRLLCDEFGCGVCVWVVGCVCECYYVVIVCCVDGVVFIFCDYVFRDDVGGRAKCVRAGVLVGEWGVVVWCVVFDEVFCGLLWWWWILLRCGDVIWWVWIFNVSRDVFGRWRRWW